MQWQNSPFYVNKSNREWKDSEEKPRRGAVSAFGVSGTNVHLVLESYPKEVPAGRGASLPYYLLALSAKTEAALTEKVEDLIAFLENTSLTDQQMGPISYTLLQGRQHFRHRYMVVAKSQADALYLLKQFDSGEPLPNSDRGVVSEEFISQKVMELFGRDLIQQSHMAATSEQYQEILQGLANLYCQGYDLPWEHLWKEEPGRVHLPTYPFARDSYWKASETEQIPVVASSQPEIAAALSVAADDKTISEPSPVGVVPSDTTEEAFHENLGWEDLQEELADSLAEALYIDRNMILPGKKFIELGLDSIVGVEWVKTLNKTYGTAIKATKVYDYPTLRDFAQYVANELGRLKKRPNKQNPLSREGKGNVKEALEAPSMTEASATSVPMDKAPALLKQKPVGQGKQDNVIRPESLGNPLFQTRYGCKWSYMAGSMAQGIASEASVIAMAEAKLLSFFGSAGLDGTRLASHIEHIQSAVGLHKPYGMCLIANVNNPEEEWEQAKLFITYGVPFIEASAFSTITAPLVYCRIKGIKKDKDGSIYFPRRIIGKCSRLEVAKQFMTPPPGDLVDQLLEEGWITKDEARLSQSIPMVDDIALEADSGGHTDQGVLSALVPSVLALRKDIQYTYSYPELILVGCGGGIGTPEAVASAFMLGADFIFTGSVNQCTVESGAHDVIKALLSTITIHDTAVTVAGDMFEIGAKAQVVRKHTQFYNRANRLYELFMQYDAIEEIPDEIKQEIETHYFKRTFAEVWDLVCEYKKKKNPQHLMEAQANPRFKMALIFKWYFAYCNRATLNGDLSEKDNFQIFCGPALGAFNQWVKGTPYEDWKKRHVVDVAALLMQQASEHLQPRYRPPVNVETPAIPQPSHKDHRSKEETAIAIVGISGQFPKADNVAAFWDNIIHGKDCISEIPPSRWPMAQYYDTDPEAPGKSTSKWMGVLEGVDQFDPAFFHIPPVEAIAMDPQQRLFLENCWSCIEDAGMRPSDLSGSRCGVFVGCATSDYGQLFKETDLNARVLMGSTTSILAARISYLLNLRGPSLAIETACSSSLVAVAEACNSLVLGNSDLALAGGVCIMAGPSLHIMTSKAGMLSQQGRCRTFDDQADGFVPGEGVGVVLLKRLSDAIRDRDTIYGVIKGWGVNQDGKTNGITAPNGQAQTELEKAVYQKFDINPAHITLVEAHGTGTKLGDPIEVEALTEAFQSFTTEKQYCALGSVKSNIGHLLTAAGIAGLIKVLLAIKHRTLPPMIHCHHLNEHIDLAHSPFYISKNKQPWITRQGIPRCAAVSSFGYSGTNAHMVVEEYLPPEEPADVTKHHAPDQPVLMVLSAKNDKQLKRYAERMIHFIQKHPDTDLQQMAYTLQVGREHMARRLAFLAYSPEEVLQTIRMYILGQRPSHLLTATFTRDRKRNRTDDRLYKAFAEGQWQEAANWWIQGGEVDWKQLYGDHLPQRMNLPTYPFERNSLWPKKDDQSTIAESGIRPVTVPEPAVGLPSTTERVLRLPDAEQQVLRPEQIQLQPLMNTKKWADDDQRQSLSPITLSPIDQPVDHQQVVQYAEDDETAVQDMLIDSLSETLFMERQEIDVDDNFHDMGLDSILGVEWMRLINKKQGLVLEATILYDYPTIRELARYIRSTKEVDARPPAKPHPTTKQQDSLDLIAELTKSLADMMYLDPSEVDEDVHFSDLGLDSILGVEWVRVLNKRYGTTIEATTLYDYPTLREFAAWMQKDQVKQTAPSTEEEAPTLSPPTLEEILRKVEQGALEVTEAHVLLQKYNLV
ncbi:PfaD family polyunsaturated fatty acid/polyketide biosynthesis protein [Melghirimyces algeriensis]|uniref:PfaD family polyunsaturated fatty acid/polyketide biosynthesis protein n=1 Tax=Melghirimyces algeriensis TaxID=910412 RepID=UPI00248296F4|nr:PfaD family polyunsaturated fatty acid/polyketide biosynthesis protein [Melghirimyces algeriensis]